MKPTATPWTVALTTALALCSFAANSLLCRLALRGHEIDPASFTAVRLVSGALLLGVLLTVRAKRREPWWRSGDWVSGSLLWLYAAAFSFAYMGLSAGSGALLLFGSVQATMIGVGLARADRPRPLEWTGLLLGFGGLVWLVLPGVSAPPIASAALMVLAGAAWGAYSLRGKLAAANPVEATAGNFLRSLPLGLVLAAAFLGQAHGSARGIGLAVVSGAVTSGLGYVAWYAALRHLTGPRAAILQLSVPLLAAVGGVAFLGEVFTLRLLVASVLVIGGVALALASKNSSANVKV